MLMEAGWREGGWVGGDPWSSGREPSGDVRRPLGGAESWHCRKVAGSLTASGELAERSCCESRGRGPCRPPGQVQPSPGG